MNLTVNFDKLSCNISSYSSCENSIPRILSLYSAALTSAEEKIIKSAIGKAREFHIRAELLYEIVLQSYLFLGFPRMLTAAEFLHKYYTYISPAEKLQKISAEESSEWYNKGEALCRIVYRNNYSLLKERVEAISPDIFRWMVIEGYGKVLSRNELSVINRELSIIAFLMMENRKKQLHSHILGAKNVGAEYNLIESVVHDIGDAAGDGYNSAIEIMGRLR